MDPSKRTAPRHLRDAPLPATCARRGRLLLLEPNELTRWSITTYLERWFAVETAESSDVAARMVERSPFDALVLSEAISPQDVTRIQRMASRPGTAVKTVCTVTAASEPVTVESQTVQLEKPFELASLARLLGVADREIPPS